MRAGAARKVLDFTQKVANAMIQYCWSCDEELKEGDQIVAAIVSVYHELPSQVAYAVQPGTECLALVHRSCFGEKGGDHETEFLEDS
jgi:hypothetical protein